MWIGIRFLWYEMDVCTGHLQNYDVMDLEDFFWFLSNVWLRKLYANYFVNYKGQPKGEMYNRTSEFNVSWNDDTFHQLPIRSVGIVQGTRSNLSRNMQWNKTDILNHNYGSVEASLTSCIISGLHEGVI